MSEAGTRPESEALLRASSMEPSGVISPPETPAPAEGSNAALPEDFGGEQEPEAGTLVVSLLTPVSVTMLLVVLLVAEMQSASQQIQGSFSELMVYQEDTEHDSASTIAGGVLLNGAAVVLMLFLVTTCLLGLYKYRCYILIYMWLFFSVCSLLGLFGGFVLQQLFEMHDVPIDTISYLFFLYNFAAGGTILVFWTEYGLGPNPPLQMQQSYLVVISALLAWSATRTPEWTTWGLLGAVAVWDLIAVLTPRGPLKLLVEEAERRNEPIPGLVYQSAHHIKLGLGDFVFYSVLVGRASMHGAAPMWVCAVAVLAGLCATLALLPILQRVLPALPISIAVGIGFYFVSAWALSPLAHQMAAARVVL